MNSRLNKYSFPPLNSNTHGEDNGKPFRGLRRIVKDPRIKPHNPDTFENDEPADEDIVREGLPTNNEV